MESLTWNRYSTTLKKSKKEKRKNTVYSLNPFFPLLLDMRVEEKPLRGGTLPEDTLIEIN